MSDDEPRIQREVPKSVRAPGGISIPIRCVAGPPMVLTLTTRPTRPALLQAEVDFAEAIASVFELAMQMLDYRTLEHQRELDNSTLRAQVLESELRALRAQLNPHFLFNTLNTIAEYTAAAPDDAERIVLKLANVLRHVLASTEQATGTLDSEISVLQDYLEIEQARFGERLETEIKFADEARFCKMPTLLLQPLVENALQHGLAPLSCGGKLWVTAVLQREMLVLRVEDNGVGIRLTSRDESRPHLGLANTRDRLQHLYGGASQLLIGSRPGGGTWVEVQIPMRGGAL